MTEKKKEKLESILRFYNEGRALGGDDKSPVVKKAYEVSKQVGMIVELLLDCDKNDLHRSDKNILEMARIHRVEKNEKVFTNRMVKEFFSDFHDYLREVN